ncbi:MAG: hypothetical protein ACT4NY_30180 [Pseudonocardiales bacterium]
MPAVDQIRHRRTATVTSTADGRDHLISEQAMTSGLAAGHGDYVAICGRVVVAAPMVAPPGPTCLDCETALHRITTSGTNSHRRCGLVTRLLRRFVRLTGARSTAVGSHRVVRR